MDPHRLILKKIAHQAMQDRGFSPDFSVQALAELEAIHTPATRTDGDPTRDLRHLALVFHRQ